MSDTQESPQNEEGTPPQEENPYEEPSDTIQTSLEPLTEPNDTIMHRDHPQEKGGDLGE